MERLRGLALAEQEGVGDRCGAGSRRRRSARAEQRGEAAVDARDTRARRSRATSAPSMRIAAPPARSSSRPPSVSTVMSQVCGPSWRQSSSARDRIAAGAGHREVGRDRGVAVLREDQARLSSRNGPGRISVRIERALMPGSKTPKPPGCQIQACPGCQRRTSSFQTMCDRADGAAGEPRLGRRRPQGRSASARWRRGTAPRARAAATIALDLAERRGGRLLEQHVAAGRERLQRHRGARARRHAERDRRRRALGEEAVEVGEVRHAVDRRRCARPPATSAKSGSAAIAGMCWSRAILPTPTMRDGKGGHQCEFPPDGVAAAALQEVEVGAGVGAADMVVVELRHSRRRAARPAASSPRAGARARRRGSSRCSRAAPARRARSCRRSAPPPAGRRAPPRARCAARPCRRRCPTCARRRSAPCR